MSMWFVYFLIKLDSLGSLFGVGAVLIGSMFVISGVACAIANIDPVSETERKFKEVVKKHFFRKFYLILFICFLISATLLPSTKQAVVIYALPKIANNEQVKELPSNVVKLINEKMKQWLEEMEGKKK